MTVKAVKGIMFIVFVCLISTTANAASLEVTCPDCANATVGSEIICTVSINSAPNEVTSFGFEFLYDSAVLSYKSFAKGNLIQNRFAYFFNVNMQSPGQLKCGGAEDDNPLPLGSSGEFLKLTFAVKAKGNCGAKFSNLVDDFKCWSANPPIVPEVPDGQIFSIREDSQDGKFVDTVAVNNYTGSVNKTLLSFSITGGNTDNVFAISDTGNITVQNSAPLNYMNIPEYSLNISVSACNETTQSLVKVKVISMKGNVNNDSDIDLQDAILALQTLTGIQSDSISLAADVNNDGRIGMEEAIFIIRSAAEIK